MGGLGFKRLRLQGRIKGSVDRLWKEREKTLKKRGESLTSMASIFDEEAKLNGDLFDSPPPSPIVLKKRKSRVALLEEEEDEEEKVTRVEVPAEGDKRKWRRLVRNLKEDFDLVADDAVNGDRSLLTGLENVDGNVKDEDEGGRESGAKKELGGGMEELGGGERGARIWVWGRRNKK